MRSFLIVISLIGLTTYSLSCRQTISYTLEYEKLVFDTNRIAIFKWDTTKYQFPINSSPLPLKHEDLIVADSLLKDAIDSFNTQISPGLYKSFDGKFSLDSFIIRQEKYRYQYFPFKDVNGQRVMIIIGFSTDFKHWKSDLYMPRLHFGMRMLELKINLHEKIRDNFAEIHLLS